MRTLRGGVGIVGLVLLAGCARPITNTQAFRGLGPCLPPEISSQFFFWPVVAFRSISLPTEDGEVAEASWVLYRRGKTAIAVTWVHSDVISVDPDPDSDDPEWIDMSLVTPVEGKLVLRRDPDTPCQWTRGDGHTATVPQAPLTLVAPSPIAFGLPIPDPADAGVAPRLLRFRPDSAGSGPPPP